jgi:hypothetical protein
MRARSLFFVGLTMSIGAACSDNKTGQNGSEVGGAGGGGGDSGGDGAVVNCTADPRVDAYTPNMQKAGQGGVLTFTLLESDPAPPGRGINVLKLKITQNGTPITGDLLAHLKMPDHGHETSVQPVITLDASSATYTINPAYLFMPGVWRIEFDAYAGSSDAGAPLDIGVFYFCVQG